MDEFPDDADQRELEISRAPAMDEDYERLAQRRDALFNPLWKEATRRYPPRKGDQGVGDAADHRGHMVVLRRQPDWLHAFHHRAGLYRAAMDLPGKPSPRSPGQPPRGRDAGADA